VVIAMVRTIDGESNWPEGAALIGVYAVIATTFWWASQISVAVTGDSGAD
jgi:Ca2+/H+ antiporter